MNRRDVYNSRKASSALKKRVIGVAIMAAVTGAALLGLMIEPDHAIAARSGAADTATPAPVAARAVQPAAAPAPAPAALARRIYPYSIIPGGVSGREELAQVIKTDKVVAAHYATFDVANAVKLTVQKPRAVYVSYRKGDQVYWTSKKLMLVKGEMLLSDGRHEMRARCANRISDTPQLPVEMNEPSAEELDSVMAVSMDPADLGMDDVPGGTYGPGLGPASSEPQSASGARRAAPGWSGGRAFAAAKPASGRATTLRPGPDGESSGSTPATPPAGATPPANGGDQGNTPGNTPPPAGQPPAPLPPPGSPPGPGPDQNPPAPPTPPGGTLPGPPDGNPPPGETPPAGIPPTQLPPPVVPEPPVFPPTEPPKTPDKPEHELPEPGTLGLCALALAGMLLTRRKPASPKR